MPRKQCAAIGPWPRKDLVKLGRIAGRRSLPAISKPGLAGRLHRARCITTSTRMLGQRPWRKFIDHPVVEWTIFAIGVLLLLVSPLVGAIPGPGGILVAGIGLAMILKTSNWARRRYVKFKRWQPSAGRWTDLALRRPSAKRRESRRKAQLHKPKQA